MRRRVTDRIGDDASAQKRLTLHTKASKLPLDNSIYYMAKMPFIRRANFEAIYLFRY